MSKEQLLDYVRDTVPINNLKGNSYIQPRIWPKVYKVGGMSEKDVHVVIHVMPMNTLLDNGNSTFMDKRSLLVSSWRRIASDALPPQNKTLGNYANSRLGENEANRLGYYGCLSWTTEDLFQRRGLHA